MEARRDVFQALADPTRRNILGILSDKPHNLNALAEHFEMSRQAISLHVKILKECGAITIQQQGRERFCELEPQKLAEVAEWLKPFRKLWEDRFDQLDTVLLKLKNKENEQDNL
jgi:DNA-binding transcriptional ArsR family regulator